MQVAAVRAGIGRAQQRLIQHSLTQSLLVLEAWGGLLLAVVALQMVQILFFPQLHPLEAVKVAPVVALPQVLLVAPVEVQVAILGLLVVLVTRLLQVHHKVTTEVPAQEQAHCPEAVAVERPLLVAMVLVR